MITLTSLNGQPVMLNCDLIESIEEDGIPSSRLRPGMRSSCCERMPEIEAQIVAFKRKIYGPREASV